jgi:hypothetical protein
MRIRLILALGLTLFSASAAAASLRHRWRIYRADPDLKVSVCYPADLLHSHHDENDPGVVSLAGDDAHVFILAHPDKYTDLKSELDHSLAENSGGPRWIHETGPGITPLHYVKIPQMRLKSSIVNRKFYLYEADDGNDIIIEFAIHVDHAIKIMEIQYPKAHALAWRGVAERMRSCFKSFGPVTNPLIM